MIKFHVQNPEKLHDLYNDLQLLPVKRKIEKVKKQLVNLHDKTEYAISIQNLKQALNHRLVLKKVHRVVKFN